MDGDREVRVGADSGGMIQGLYVAIARRWPAMIAYALAGAVILWACALAGDHGYRAVASVVVHHHVERAHPDANEREIFNYINRETVTLETVAYSDAVWDRVFEQLAREGWLPTPDAGSRLFDRTRLPHPMNGEWQFAASAEDPGLTARLANLWAESFVEVVNDGVALAFRADSERARVRNQERLLGEAEQSCVAIGRTASEVNALLESLAAAPADPVLQERLGQVAEALGFPCDLPGCEPEATSGEIVGLAGRLALAAQARLGACQDGVTALEGNLQEAIRREGETVPGLELSPYLEVSLLRQAEIPHDPVVATGWYLIVGVLLGLAAWVAREGIRSSQARPENQGE
jgi:hypothetical protein